MFVLYYHLTSSLRVQPSDIEEHIKAKNRRKMSIGCTNPALICLVRSF